MPTGPGWQRKTSAETEKKRRSSTLKREKTTQQHEDEGNGTKDINFNVLVWLRARSEHTHTFCSIYQSGNETNFVDECLLFRKFHVAFNRPEILAVLVYCGRFASWEKKRNKHDG